MKVMYCHAVWQMLYLSGRSSVSCFGRNDGRNLLGSDGFGPLNEDDLRMLFAFFFSLLQRPLPLALLGRGTRTGAVDDCVEVSVSDMVFSETKDCGRIT